MALALAQAILRPKTPGWPAGLPARVVGPPRMALALALASRLASRLALALPLDVALALALAVKMAVDTDAMSVVRVRRLCPSHVSVSGSL